LVKRRHILNEGQTIFTVRVPSHTAPFWFDWPWKRAELYIYTCKDNNTPENISAIATRIVSQRLVVAFIVLILIFLYVLGAFSLKSKNNPWYFNLNPVVMTADSDGTGSLSKLQILFFTLIVFSLISVLVLCTGKLTDISATVLSLLGIAAVGSTAARGADQTRNSLDIDNRAWLVRMKWLCKGESVTGTTPSWTHIFTTDGEFDVYRYQSFIFSLVIGCALIFGGVAELASFDIPPNVLAVLGLSQGVYIAGKLVTPTAVGALDKAITELRQLEAKLKMALEDSPGVKTCEEAKASAPAGYSAYIEKAESVRDLFQSIKGDTGQVLRTEPNWLVKKSDL
jgi:hypothetical protein